MLDKSFCEDFDNDIKTLKNDLSADLDKLYIFGDVNVDHYEVQILIELLPSEKRLFKIFKYDVDYFSDNREKCMSKIKKYCYSILK